MGNSARIARMIDDHHVLSVHVFLDGQPTVLLRALRHLIASDGAERTVRDSLAHGWLTFHRVVSDGGPWFRAGESDNSSQYISKIVDGVRPFTPREAAWVYLFGEDLSDVRVWGPTSQVRRLSRSGLSFVDLAELEHSTTTVVGSVAV